MNIIKVLAVLFLFACNVETPIKKLSDISPKGVISLKLYVFESGMLKCKDMSVLFSEMNKGTEAVLACPTYLIIHPKGTLIWDAGLTDTLSQFENGIDVWGGGWNVSVSKTLKSQLNELNLNTASINYLALSHIHPDHTGNASLFKESILLVQKNVKDSIFEINKYGNLSDYSMFKSRSKFINPVFDVFGDGSVVIISASGHSIGDQQVLYVDLPNNGPILLSADLHISAEAYENQWVSIGNRKVEINKSISKIDMFLRRTKTSLWIQHEIEQFRKLKLSPKFYE